MFLSRTAKKHEWQFLLLSLKKYQEIWHFEEKRNHKVERKENESLHTFTTFMWLLHAVLHFQTSVLPHFPKLLKKALNVGYNYDHSHNLHGDYVYFLTSKYKAAELITNDSRYQPILQSNRFRKAEFTSERRLQHISQFSFHLCLSGHLKP